MAIGYLDLHTYLNSNEPLPDHLREPLDRFLGRLDTQWDIYERARRNAEEAIESRQSMIQALEREVEAFSRLKEQAIRSQNALRSKKKRYASSVTAIRRMPLEVIAVIIGFAIQGSDGLVHHEERQLFTNIRSVCRLWREASLSTPSLWRAIGLDIVPLRLQRADIPAYVWGNLMPWFLRAGEGAPLRIQVYGALATTVSVTIDFMSSTGFNFTSLAFSTPPEKPSNALLSYHDFKYIVQAAREVVSLTQHFPNLMDLSLVESTPSTLVFPLKIVHEGLLYLNLVGLLLTPESMNLVLSGLPRLQVLHLDCCEGKIVANSSTACHHYALQALFISETIPEACFGGLACTALTEVYIRGTHPNTPHNPGFGRIFGEFLQRSGHIERFNLRGKWPAGLLENVINSNATLPVVGVDLLSLFIASPGVGNRLIKVPPSVGVIEITEKATESQLRDFSNLFAPLETQTLVVHVPNGTPYTTAYFPLPRPGNDRNYVLCHALSDLENPSCWVH
ncbi:hypothetical protein BKA70DRAFT_1577775 [Coprinopsis sp. MPI-PUGE-AT-0042]|nr:hypothetical protein BKA70DRAFT_1577775 [Coprinopsis sp. MPI-PUGE-AT-0042]